MYFINTLACIAHFNTAKTDIRGSGKFFLRRKGDRNLAIWPAIADTIFYQILNHLHQLILTAPDDQRGFRQWKFQRNFCFFGLILQTGDDAAAYHAQVTFILRGLMFGLLDAGQ